MSCLAALDLNEIPGIVAEYRRGAENAKRAGFDGVEVHGANGYLLDEFLQDSTNLRTDAYGGSIENRARLMLEVVDACIAVWGADRVGLHLAPRGDAVSMGDSNPLATFGYVAQAMGRRKIAFLCTRERQGPNSISPQLKKMFGGAMIANEKFTKETAEAAIEAGRPMPSPSVSSTSPIRICRHVSSSMRRSTRPILTPAPTLGEDAEAQERIRMTDTSRRKPLRNKTLQAVPGQITLTATAQHQSPQLTHGLAKRTQRRTIQGRFLQTGVVV